MRRQVVLVLKFLCGKQNRYVTTCESWEDLLSRKQMGAVLWLGDGGKKSSVTDTEESLSNREDGQIEKEDSTGKLVGEFATLDLKKDARSKVSVYNLQLLFGEAHMEDLRKHLPEKFNAEFVVIRDRKATIDLQLRLWKLQGYIAKYEQADST
jgi:hypothetical protein